MNALFARPVILLAASVILVANAGGQARLPELNRGIAAKFPGDDGIETDQRVIFVEKFDQANMEALFKRWHEARNRKGISFSKDVPAGSADDQSMLITHTGGNGNGSHLYRNFGKNYDQIFARFYVKFSKDCAPVHHMGTNLGGHNPMTRWPIGGAGKRPAGDKHFWTGVEPFGKNWNWDFYTYWQGMHRHGDGRFWGTPFLQGVKKPAVERGRWICVEMMVKLNAANAADHSGEQAFWIDGKLWRVDGKVVSHIGKGFPSGRWKGGWWSPDARAESRFDGFNWRSVEQLGVNRLWTYLYITKAPVGHVSRVWFDNIVVATGYIGPIGEKDR